MAGVVRARRRRRSSCPGGRSRTASAISPRCSSSVSVAASPVVAGHDEPVGAVCGEMVHQRHERLLVDAPPLVERRDDRGQDRARGSCAGHRGRCRGSCAGVFASSRIHSEEQPSPAPPTGDSSQLADPAHREQHAGHERLAVDRVVADRQRLADVAEDHLLVGDQARAGAPSGSAARSPPARLRAISSRRELRRPARRVELAVVVELDDLRARPCAWPPPRRSASSAPPRSRSSARPARWRRGSPAGVRALAQRLRGRIRSCRSRRARPPARTRARSRSAVSGRVKSTTTSARGSRQHVRERDDPSSGSARPTSSMSGAPSTAAHTGRAHPPGGARDRDPITRATASPSGARAPRRNAPPLAPTPAARQRSRRRDSSSREARASPRRVDRVDPVDDLVDREDRHARPAAPSPGGSCARPLTPATAPPGP